MAKGRPKLATAPKGTAPEEIRSRLDTTEDSLPPAASQPKSPAAQRLNRLTARLGALCVWRDDILDRIDTAQDLQDRGALFPLEQDGDAVAAWRLAAGGVVLDIGHQDDMRRAE